MKLEFLVIWDKFLPINWLYIYEKRFLEKLLLSLIIFRYGLMIKASEKIFKINFYIIAVSIDLFITNCSCFIVTDHFIWYTTKVIFQKTFLKPCRKALFFVQRNGPWDWYQIGMLYTKVSRFYGEKRYLR